MLTLALTAHEDSLCPGCGQPKDVAYNPDSDGWYEAAEVVCAGCKAQHDHGKGQKEPTPGGKVFVIDSRPADEPLRPWALSAPHGQAAEQPA